MKNRFLLPLMVIFLISFYQLSAQDAPKSDKIEMHRYLVERTFPNGLIIPIDKVGTDMCLTVVSNNAEDDVTWVYSYVTKAKKKTFCI